MFTTESHAAKCEGSALASRLVLHEALLLLPLACGVQAKASLRTWSCCGTLIFRSNLVQHREKAQESGLYDELTGLVLCVLRGHSTNGENQIQKTLTWAIPLNALSSIVCQNSLV